MSTLSEYLMQTRALLNDPSAQFYSTVNLTRWINLGRKKVSQDAQCVRIKCRSSATILTITVTDGGAGYTTAPTVTITAPNAYGVGFTQATATAHLTGDAVTTVTVDVNGTGYVTATVSFSGGDGSGATATANLSSFLHTVVSQEVYDFATASAVIQDQEEGAFEVVGVQTVAVSWGASKPVLRQYPWSAFQAYLRSVNIVSQNYPSIWAQYAQGVRGSVYLFPIPATLAQMEWDCYCTTADLVDDESIDLIPYPWTEVVPFYACYYAYLNAQRGDDAQRMLADYKRLVIEGRMGSTPAVVPSFY